MLGEVHAWQVVVGVGLDGVTKITLISSPHLCRTIAISDPDIQNLQQQTICGGWGSEAARLRPQRPLAAGWQAWHVCEA